MPIIILCHAAQNLRTRPKVIQYVRPNCARLIVWLSLCCLWHYPSPALAQTGIEPTLLALEQPNLAATWFVADSETMLLLVGPSNVADEPSYQLLAINMESGESHTLDSFPVLCVCDIDIAASADGEQIIVSDGMRLRMINTEQGIVRNLITLETPSIRQIRISADGQMIAFILAHDTLLSGTTRIFEQRSTLYIDGRGCRRLHVPGLWPGRRPVRQR